MMKLYNAEIFCCHGCMVEPDTTVIFITTLVRKGVPSQPSWATLLEIASVAPVIYSSACTRGKYGTARLRLFFCSRVHRCFTVMVS